MVPEPVTSLRLTLMFVSPLLPIDTAGGFAESEHTTGDGFGLGFGETPGLGLKPGEAPGDGLAAG